MFLTSHLSLLKKTYYNAPSVPCSDTRSATSSMYCDIRSAFMPEQLNYRKREDTHKNVSYSITSTFSNVMHDKIQLEQRYETTVAPSKTGCLGYIGKTRKAHMTPAHWRVHLMARLIFTEPTMRALIVKIIISGRFATENILHIASAACVQMERDARDNGCWSKLLAYKFFK